MEKAGAPASEVEAEIGKRCFDHCIEDGGDYFDAAAAFEPFALAVQYQAAKIAASTG